MLNLLMTEKRRNKTTAVLCVWVCLYIYIYICMHVCICEPKYFCIWDANLSKWQQLSLLCAPWELAFCLFFSPLSLSFAPFLFLATIWPSSSPNRFATTNSRGSRVPPKWFYDHQSLPSLHVLPDVFLLCNIHFSLFSVKNVLLYSKLRETFSLKAQQWPQSSKSKALEGPRGMGRHMQLNTSQCHYSFIQKGKEYISTNQKYLQFQGKFTK